jgi:hypothetical protein
MDENVGFESNFPHKFLTNFLLRTLLGSLSQGLGLRRLDSMQILLEE